MTELEDGFARQLEVDQQRALELIKPESTAATIITSLYPLLRGRLYPEGKSGEIARRLEDCIEGEIPFNLLAVLVQQTTKTELPYVVRAIEAIRKPGINIVSTAILVDWPEKSSRTPIEPAENYEAVKDKVMETGVFDRIENVNFEFEDLDNLDPKLLGWSVNFYSRQRTMADVERVIGFEAKFDLAMRQKIGRIISFASKNGFSLGLTTELNPSLLRCYGQDIYLANLDVKPKA